MASNTALQRLMSDVCIRGSPEERDGLQQSYPSP
eukprot:CAMPEP_0171200820 /NCGR_PEP_ID=MMETSP0790-20130122/24176_1 /TAXON_ID=2925 /ORGANISM="Alexandrium catenella, Strain OF101" /LENGTH=33 /DNA_ID= /DNA_START= /DNA_END= /DNA_ORIENTATION=